LHLHGKILHVNLSKDTEKMKCHITSTEKAIQLGSKQRFYFMY